MSEINKNIPKDGFAGLKENWKSDALSGFLIFLIALPLSLGIAKASGFPAVTGLFTAITGGIVVSFFSGGLLTIKGPAAGLIVIAAGAVDELAKYAGGDEHLGYQLTLAVVVVAALTQILFGVLKLGSLSDFFPTAAVHGMLAAIGIIIMSKQIHVAMGIHPSELKHKEPLELIAMIPHSILTMDKTITIVGFVSLLIMFGMPLIKNDFIKKIPPALVVLSVAIPLGILLNFKAHHLVGAHEIFDHPDADVELGNLWDTLTYADFSAISSSIFWKFVLMFALVGSLESLLTAKAIDMLDPYRRKTNFNKDLISVGIGNTLAGLIGGSPMISEVARSSANVRNGAKTRWANFFHGLFILIFVLLATPLIELIPNAALAAMLIAVGFKLAAPKEFIHTYKIGAEQLVIFVSTVIVTLATDLLIGVGTGIVVKIIIHIINGVPFSNLFSPNMKVEHDAQNKYIVKARNAAVFSNFISLKKELKRIPEKKEVVLDLCETPLVDHTVMEGLHHFAEEYNRNGGNFKIVGLEEHQPLSAHPHAARKKVKK